MSKKVRYYFAYNSPYSFLANTRIEEALASYDVEIEYKPVYSPRTGGGPDLESPKLKYIFEDFARFCEDYGIEPRLGSFADTKRACKGFLFAQANGCGKPYHDGVYAARFLEERDIGDDTVLADIAERAGLDREAFLSALDDATYNAALDTSNKDAEADEVFGFPFFIVGSQRFWGNDRIEWLVRELQKGP